MLSNHTIARPYARGVYSVAKSTQTIPLWSNALQTLAQLVRDERISAVIKNPMIKKQEVVDLLMQAANLDHQDINNFLSLLARYNRLTYLPDIDALFIALCHEDEKTLDAEFITPMDASTETVALLQQRLEQRYQRKIHLTVRIDKTLIGGGIIRIGDQVIDGSLKNKINNLTKHLLTTEGTHAA